MPKRIAPLVNGFNGVDGCHGESDNCGNGYLRYKAVEFSGEEDLLALHRLMRRTSRRGHVRQAVATWRSSVAVSATSVVLIWVAQDVHTVPTRGTKHGAVWVAVP